MAWSQQALPKKCESPCSEVRERESERRTRRTGWTTYIWNDVDVFGWFTRRRSERDIGNANPSLPLGPASWTMHITRKVGKQGIKGDYLSKWNETASFETKKILVSPAGDVAKPQSYLAPLFEYLTPLRTRSRGSQPSSPPLLHSSNDYSNLYLLAI